MRRAFLLLFLLGAWPVWVVRIPPLQDLPNHLAAAVVQAHPAAYPELVSNGFWKTNSALFLFLHLLGGPLGLVLAAKLFVTLTIAAGAWAYPHVIERFAGREKVYGAALVLWPMVHNWFVAMGMLDYALAVPLALETLVWLDASVRKPSAGAAVAAAACAMLAWYAHAFAVIVLVLLVGVECLRPPRDVKRIWRLWLPLLPAVALTAASALTQLASETRAGAVGTELRGVLGLAYGAFSEWLWSMTKWTAVAAVAGATLAWFGARRFRESYPFFSPAAFAALGVLYLLLPYHTHRWFYVGSRLLPFLWMACALRVPPTLRPGLRGLLAASAVAWSVGLGFEYVQTAHDWDELRRAEVAVPEGSRLLPLVFDRKGPHGENTWPMLHSWGLFVVDRQTSAPLLFAHSRSFPVTYAHEPPPRFHQLNLEAFPKAMATSKAYCAEITESVVLDDCAEHYRSAWKEFWADASPRFDRVLMYHPSDEVRAAIPEDFDVVYDVNGVVVLAHRGAAKG